MLRKQSDKFNNLSEAINDKIKRDSMTLLYGGKVTPFNKHLIKEISRRYYERPNQ